MVTFETPLEVINKMRVDLNARSPVVREYWSVFVNNQTFHGFYSEHDAMVIGQEFDV